VSLMWRRSCPSVSASSSAKSAAGSPVGASTAPLLEKKGDSFHSSSSCLDRMKTVLPSASGGVEGVASVEGVARLFADLDGLALRQLA